MEAKFEEKQSAIWILPLLVVSILLMCYGYFASPPDSMNMLGFILVITMMLIVGLFFYQLKTTVDNEAVKLAFGIGLINKRILLSDIEEVKVVRNKWYYGWGIRYFGRGWLWNIWGLDAVELNITGKRNVIRIGSQKVKKLNENITLKIAKN